MSRRGCAAQHISRWTKQTRWNVREKNITKGWKRRKILSSVCRGQSRILAALKGFTGVISLFPFFFSPHRLWGLLHTSVSGGREKKATQNLKVKRDVTFSCFYLESSLVSVFFPFFPEERNSSKGRGTFNNGVAYSRPHLREQWWAFTAFPPPVSRPSPARCHQSTSVTGGGQQARLRSRLFLFSFFLKNRLRHPKSSLIASRWV